MPRSGGGSRRSRRERWTAFELVGGVVLVGWLIGQIARDATLFTALLFYVPSLLVAAALALLGALALALGRRWRPTLLVALVPLAFGLLAEHRWLPRAAPPPPAAGPLRLLHWNVSGGWAGLDEIAAEIARCEPDVVVLSEAPERVARRVAAELPGFDAATRGGLTVAAADLGALDWVEREREMEVIAAEVGWRGRRLELLVVNLASSPWVPRRPLLDRVRAEIASRTPDLVVGDFNAPRRSRALSRLPPSYRHAYDLAGRGWSATWPVPVPLLAIDQLIVGRAIGVRRYELHGTPWSDHRYQLATLEVAPGG